LARLPGSIGVTFYVDSCIYLNLWKREERNGVAFWKFAKNFFEHIEKSQDVIYISSFILKELCFAQDVNDLQEKIVNIRHSQLFKGVAADSNDYANARRMESSAKFEISFFDCMHIALAKRIGATLITRDKKLLSFARGLCLVSKPEDIQK